MKLHAMLSWILICASMVGCGDDGAGNDIDAQSSVDAQPAVDAQSAADAGPAPVDVEALYQAALIDAEIAEESEIVDTLVAITDDNTDLIRDAENRVLMVTWTSYDGYDTLVGQSTDLGVDVWTTVAPALEMFCQAGGLSANDLDLRLEQWLGLPPGDGNDRVVELWVTPADLFRPSPDPEITDSIAELSFPPDTPQAHIDWINELQAISYDPDSGYPWTRLGYTYDWNPDTSEVGPSEFVIAQGASVVVERVASTSEYCQP